MSIVECICKIHNLLIKALQEVCIGRKELYAGSQVRGNRMAVAHATVGAMYK